MVLNNVETFASVPLIVRNDVEGYHSIGIERGHGTKDIAICPAPWKDESPKAGVRP